MGGNRLSEILVKAKVIDDLQLRSALAHQAQWGGRVPKIIVERRFAREPAVVKAIADALGLKRVELAKVERDAGALAKVEEGFCRDRAVFPWSLRDNGKTLWIAMADPTDIVTVDDIASRTRTRVMTVVAGEDEIMAALDRHYRGHAAPIAVRSFDPSEAEGLRHPSGEFEMLDSSGEAMMPGGENLLPPGEQLFPNENDEPAAPPPPKPAAPKPGAGWTPEQLARLTRLRDLQSKSSRVVRALVDLSVEKKLFKAEEYSARYGKGR